MSSEARSDYNTYTNVTVRNDFGETADIRLSHRYSDDPEEILEWKGVPPGQAGEAFTVGYNTGFGHNGTDHWYASAKWGDGQWQTERIHACQLTKSDANQDLVFSVGPSATYDPGLSMNIPSGSCWQAMVWVAT